MQYHKNFKFQFKLFIFDLDGVIYRNYIPIPYAVECINELQEKSNRIYFLTNNSTASRKKYVEKLANIGIFTVEDNIVSSGYATKLYLEKCGNGCLKLYIIGNKGLFEELEMFNIVNDIPDTQPDYVVVGLDKELTYNKLERAHLAIMNGAIFVATNNDASFPAEEGKLLPGAGAIVSAVETSTGKKAIVIGKPQPMALELIIERENCDKKEVLLIGDRAETDVVAGKRCGIKTVLVLTGVTDKKRVKELSEEEKPDFIIKNLSYLNEILLKNF